MQKKHEKVLIINAPGIGAKFAITTPQTNLSKLLVSKYVEVTEEQFDEIHTSASFYENTNQVIKFAIAATRFIVTNKQDDEMLTGMVEFAKKTNEYQKLKYEHNLN
jgi:hypothetical protein